jgi:hypothetical protein
MVQHQARQRNACQFGGADRFANDWCRYHACRRTNNAQRALAYCLCQFDLCLGTFLQLPLSYKYPARGRSGGLHCHSAAIRRDGTAEGQRERRIEQPLTDQTAFMAI